MSTEVQAVVEKVRQFTREQREELVAAIGSMDGEVRVLSHEERARLVHTVKGKYRDMTSPSEEFLRRKHEDTERER